MKIRRLFLGVFFSVFLLSSCIATETVPSRSPDTSDAPLLEPPIGAVIPADLAPPLFKWPDTSDGPWRVEIRAQSDLEPLRLTAKQNPWEPSEMDWEAIKKIAPNQALTLRIRAMRGKDMHRSFSTTFTVSSIPLASQIIYLDIPVPFAVAEKDVAKLQWRLLDPSACASSCVVLEKLPYCANCHTFSDNGQLFGLDIDYRGDKGGFILAKIAPQIIVRQEHVISWNDLDRNAQSPSRGLFARISPNGEHVLATVKERPFLVRINDPAYSQLFFPLTGQIAAYSVANRTFHLLSGASEPDIIQTNPAWSHDEQTVAFARGKAAQNLWDTLGNKKVLDAPVGENIHSLNAKHRMQFDLWQIPFNEGRGGMASAITGASGNGMSNYFPRYTPDGKWLVFCRAETGLVSQPGSKLVLIPAKGGTAREMRCNRRELNSWHSFSSNGRWMIFSSKEEDGLLTRAYLTHIDEQGQDSPAIFLHRIGSPDRAAILPELIRLPPEGLQRIQLVEP